MGEVYLAEHRSLNRPYAIKLIRADVAANPTSRTRFAREIQAMARLTHWNTTEIVDYGHAPDGIFYYVMEYVDGLNLNELVNRYGPLNPGRAVYLLRQACASLAEAHAMGLIHRDIKPGNIMVTQRAGLADVVKILDFGLVHDLGPSDGDDRLTQPGLLIGTPGYMSPEQATGTADVRSDIYSLGAVGYFLLTGHAPFRGREMQQFRTEPTPLRDLRPEVSRDLETVILKCLRCDPEERYADIEQVDAALAVCDCATSWSSAEAVAWWRVARDPAMATTEAPGARAPSSETRH
jgi:serine/threonine-protein kinase